MPGTRLGEYLRLCATAAGQGRRSGRRSHRLLGPAVPAAGASAAARGAEHRAAGGLGGAGVGGGARDAGGGRQGVPPADRARGARPGLHRAGDRASARARTSRCGSTMSCARCALTAAGSRRSISAPRPRRSAPATRSSWRCRAMQRRALVPGLSVPQGHRAIANAHFRIDVPPGMPPMLGIINGTTEWVFAFAGRLSVTISNADRLMEVPRAMLAQTIWQEVSRAVGIAAELPPWQIVRERRATFAATPEENAKRPPRANGMEQSRSGRRLDRDRIARDIGERGAVRQSCGGGRALSADRRSGMTPDRANLERSIAAATRALLDCQQPDGDWCFELEADCHHSRRIRAAAPLSRRAGRCRAGSARSRSICGGRKARSTAAGRCSRTATST